MSQTQSKSPTSTCALSDLPTPSFIVNQHAFVKNCAKVNKEALKNGIHRIRPHVKTHKTMEGAFIQANCRPPPKDGALTEYEYKYPRSTDTSARVCGFVASTIPEIEMLLQAGKRYDGYGMSCNFNPFFDIIYAVPICEHKIRRIDKLLSANPGVRIHALIDHPAQVEMVENFVADEKSTRPDSFYTIFVKLDTGYHRAGITCDERGIDLAMKIMASSAVSLQGLYSHCGHAYDTSDVDELDDIAQKDLTMILKFKQDLKQRVSAEGKDEHLSRIDLLDFSVGSTPSLFHHRNISSDPNLESRLEIHPGNYTFYDRQQVWSGAAQDESCLAGRVLTRVIGHYEDRNTLMLDAGATALTKDDAPQGGVCAISWRPDLECYKMSQEVILVRPRDSTKKLDFAEFALGSVLTLLPNHSCLAAACFDKYYVIDDETSKFAAEEQVIDEWIPVKGW